MKIMNESHGATYLVCRHVFVLFAGCTYSFSVVQVCLT